MSFALLASLGVLLVAVVLVEIRAVRMGDERREHAPGYAAVLVGVALIAAGVGVALLEMYGLAVFGSAIGLALVAVGASQHRQAPAH